MNNSESQKPLITIIVSIYNAEKTLQRLLDSLAFQTSRNFETIIVNKASTDKSKEIAILYAEKYPEIFKYYDRPYSLSPSTAMAFALKIAKGDYITRCDPDDWYELDAVETMENSINNNQADIYCFNANKIELNPNRNNGITGEFPESLNIKSFLCGAFMLSYWNKLFKKNLYDNVPYLETDYQFDDWGVSLIYGSYAESIVGVKKPIYNYIFNQGITVTDPIPNVSHTDIFDYILSHCNQKYRPEVLHAIYYRIPAYYYGQFALCQRSFADWVKKNKDEIFSNKYIDDTAGLKRNLEIISRHREKKIPNIAYVNGFEKEYTKESIDELRKKLFLWGQGDIIVLDEQYLEKCPQSIRDAYYDGKRHYAINYVSIKSVNETGGYYIGKRVNVLKPIDSTDTCDAFFSYDTNTTLTDEIFGSSQNSKILNELLETYNQEKFYNDKFIPLKDRIKNILCAKYDLPLDGKKASLSCATVFPIDKFVIKFANITAFTTIDYSDMINTSGYIVVNVENMSITPSASNSTNEFARLKNAELQLNNIRTSDSYKLAQRIKRIANTKVCKPFKKLFKWFLKKYRKHKYGMN